MSTEAMTGGAVAMAAPARVFLAMASGYEEDPTDAVVGVFRELSSGVAACEGHRVEEFQGSSGLEWHNYDWGSFATCTLPSGLAVEYSVTVQEVQP